MFTLDTLPKHGTIYIFATGNRVTPESAGEGVPDESGWVTRTQFGSDGSDTPVNFYESRNDVEPVFTCNTEDLDEEAENKIISLVNRLGSNSTDDGSTLYSQEPEENWVTGDNYSYTLHAFVKHYTHHLGETARGEWLETPLAIV